MKKLLKVCGALIVIGIVLVVISSVLLHIFLPPEKAKALVVEQLTSHLHRQVEIGDVSVGIISGLSVAHLKISESPDFSKGTFLSSDLFSLHVALIPLLFRKVEIRHVILRHPEVTLVRLPDGKTFNFSDLMGAPPATVAPAQAGSPVKPSALPLRSPATPVEAPRTTSGETPTDTAVASPKIDGKSASSEPPFLLLVSNAEISKGVIHFRDQSPAKQSAEINPLDLKLKNVSLTSPFTIQCSMKAVSKGLEAELHLVGEAELAAGSFKIKSCSLSSGGSTLNLSGTASQIKTSHPAADLKLDIKEFNPTTLKPFMALPPDVRISGPIVGQATVKGDDKHMAFGAKIDLGKTDVAYGTQFHKPSKDAMAFSVRGSVQSLQNAQIEELGVILGALQANAHGSVQGLTSAQPSINLHLETNSFPIADLQRYAPSSFPPGIHLGGNAHLATDVSGTAVSSSIKAKLDGTEMSIVKTDQFNKPAGTPFEASLSGELLRPVPQQQTFVFQSIAGTVGPIKLQGSGSYKTVGAKSEINLALKSNAWPVQDAAKLVPLLGEYKPSGLVTLDLHASGSPSAPTAKGVLNLQDVAAHYRQSELNHITSAIDFTQEDVTIPKLVAKLNGADLSVKLTGRQLLTQPDIVVDSSISSLDLDKILPPLSGSPTASIAPLRTGAGLLPLAYADPPTPAVSAGPPIKTSGHLTIGKIKHELYQAQNMDFKWNLTDVTPDLARVSGSANLRQGEGKVTNVEKLATVSRAIRIALFPLITLQKLDKKGLLQSIHLPSLQSIPFNSIKGDYALHLGTMDIQTFELNGRDLLIQTQGSVGLAGVQPLNMKVLMKLAKGTLGGTLGQLIQDENGRPTFSFAATGSVADPHIKLDVQEAGRKAVQQVGQELLKNLGFGGQKQAPPSPAPADSGNPPPPALKPQENSVDQLQKQLKDIFH